MAELGIQLPNESLEPVGSFCNVRESRGMLYVAGQGPILQDGTKMTGKVGQDVSAEEAREHAEVVALNILAAVRSHTGSLDCIGGVVKLLGLVNAVPEFDRHPYVIDGASDLFIAVFGGAGVHARSAIGVGSLPNRITVEIEAILELLD